MNELNDDPLLDSLLEEFLGDKRPPDLRRSILNRVSDTPATDVVRRWEDAIAAAATPSIDAMLRSLPPARESVQPDDIALSLAITLSQRSTSEPRSRDPRLVGAWSFVALGIAAALAMVWYGPSFNQKTIVLNPIDETRGAANASPQELTGFDSVPNSTRTKQARDRQKHSPRQERESTTHTATESETPIFSMASPSSSQSTRPRSVTESERLELPQIVQVVNGQFRELWNKRKVEVSPAISNEQWLERVTQRLLGRDPTLAEREMVSTWSHTSQRLALVESLTESDEFATHWGTWLAQQWLPPSTNLTARRQFESWLVHAIDQRVPMNEIQKSLLTPTAIEAGAEFRPSVVWLIQHASQGGQHFAERFCRVMLEQPMVCSRCHESQAGSRAVYFGFASLLSGVETRQIGNRSPSLTVGRGQRQYYELHDGTLKGADACLPDGTHTDRDIPFHALTTWFLEAPERRQALVNRIWTEMFGSPLVPIYGLSAEEGLNDRIDLRDFLADQWSLQGEDIRQVLSWLACSEVFERSSLELNREEYLLASDESLGSIRDAVQLFASFPPAKPKDLDPTQAFVQLLQAESSRLSGTTLGQVPDRNLLSSPTSSTPSTSPPSTSPDGFVDAARFQWLSPRLESGLEHQIDRWTKAKMPWELMVQHAFWMSRGEEPDEVQLANAQALLESSRGDESKALRKLLAFELGYY